MKVAKGSNKFTSNLRSNSIKIEFFFLYLLKNKNKYDWTFMGETLFFILQNIVNTIRKTRYNYVIISVKNK